MGTSGSASKEEIVLVLDLGVRYAHILVYPVHVRLLFIAVIAPVSEDLLLVRNIELILILIFISHLAVFQAGKLFPNLSIVSFQISIPFLIICCEDDQIPLILLRN